MIDQSPTPLPPLEVDAPEEDASRPQVACVTDRGIPKKYWDHFDCYELSTHDLSAKPSTLRRWREAAPQGASLISRIGPELATHKFVGEAAEEAWALDLKRQEALGASAMLLHTPSSFRPSEEHYRAVTSFLEKAERPCPLIWRADGLWEESERYFEFCATHEITPAIDPLVWDEEEPFPEGDTYYWRVMGGQGLNPRLSDYDLDQLLELCETAGTQGWVVFSSPHMYQTARRWRILAEG